METSFALLAVEYWKLLKIVEALIDGSPPGARERLASKARYAASRLEVILAQQNMSCQEFEGMKFEANLAASAINAEEFKSTERTIITQTLEPAIVRETTVIHTGRVLLGQGG